MILRLCDVVVLLSCSGNTVVVSCLLSDVVVVSSKVYYVPLLFVLFVLFVDVFVVVVVKVGVAFWFY